MERLRWAPIDGRMQVLSPDNACVLFAPAAPVLEFRLLGPAELRRPADGDLQAILRQPKRLALLAYLAASTEHRFVRRDVLLALFWPEVDTRRARNRLRQALHFLRSDLDGAIVTRGEEEVGIDRTRLWCDVVAFTEAVANKQPGAAVELYRGDLLEGFHVAGLPEFEEWLDRQRRRMRAEAVQTGWTVGERAEGDGQV